MKNVLRVLTLAALTAPFAPACASGNDLPVIVVEDAPEADPSSLSVTGRGTATAEPDILEFDVGVSVLRSSVSAAIPVASRQADAVLDMLLRNDVPRGDIQTVDYRIAPEYSWKDDTQTLEGYRVTNLVRVRLRALERAGEILDAVVAAGGDVVRIQNLEFTLDDPSRALAEAREDAWKDARARASQLAALAGVELGDPLAIEESSSWTQPVPIFEASSSLAKSTPIEGGRIEVTATVEVRFSIDEDGEDVEVATLSSP
jgi:uncharacterized protein YggE